MQEKILQDTWHNHNIEQEIYWAQRAHQNWIALGDKNAKFFQTVTTIRKRKNTIYKTLDEIRIWSNNQNFVL